MTPHYTDDWLTVYLGDCREVLAKLPAESVHCVVTSPPYWGLRDYGIPGQLGLEPTPDAYIEAMVGVFREVRRVLRRDGTCWVNMGDGYASGSRMSDTERDAMKERGTRRGYDSGNAFANYSERIDRMPSVPGLKPKDLIGMPWRLAFALQADGWYLRSDIIWAKPNPMPESVTDRPTKSHEYLFLLTRSPKYYYDNDGVREPHMESRGRGGSGGTHDSATPHAGRRDGGEQAAFTVGRREYNPAGRNLRTVWTIATQPYPGAHFATFPEALVEPCVKAGTSERGVCPECGAPWVREVERTLHPVQRTFDAGRSSDTAVKRFQDGYVPAKQTTETTGWRPGCAHRHQFGTSMPSDGPPDCLVCEAGYHIETDWHDPIPATVLDPFAGSGTTARVANRLSRRAILIDLSADYLDQAMLRNAQPPLGV